MTTLRGLTLAVSVCMLAACASSSYKALETSKQTKVTASEGVLGVQQPELGVTAEPVIVPVATGVVLLSGFGVVAESVSALAGTEIVDSELRRAEKAVGPLRNELLGFDFDGQALATMQAELPKVTWLHLDKVTLTKDVSSEAYDKILDSTQVPYTLFVTEGYVLTDDLQQLYVVAQIGLLPKPTPGSTVRQGPNGTAFTVPASDISNAIYANVVYYQTAIPEDAYEKLKAQVEAEPVPPHGYVDVDRVAAVRYWSQDNAAPIKRALTDATAELARLAAQCLQNPGKLADFKDEVAFGTKEGHVLGPDGDARTVIQFDDGSVLSLDNGFLKVLHTGKMY